MLDSSRCSLTVVACLFLAILFVAPCLAQAYEREDDSDLFLTGDKEDACTAILCFSSSRRPSECDPAIRRYYSIKRSKPHKTARARRNFLKLCPVSNETGMSDHIANIVEVAPYCDASGLNNNTLDAYRTYDKRTGQWSAWADGAPRDIPTCQGRDTQIVWGKRSSWHQEDDYRICKVTKKVISDQMPTKCRNFHNSGNTDYSSLKYVGEKYEGGHWVGE